LKKLAHLILNKINGTSDRAGSLIEGPGAGGGVAGPGTKKGAPCRAPLDHIIQFISSNASEQKPGLNLVNHRDGFLRAGVHTGFAIDALIGVHEGVSINHGDHFGGAGINTFFASIAFADIDEGRHFNPPEDGG
jgi:hypothetical protein